MHKNAETGLNKQNETKIRMAQKSDTTRLANLFRSTILQFIGNEETAEDLAFEIACEMDGAVCESELYNAAIIPLSKTEGKNREVRNASPQTINKLEDCAITEDKISSTLNSALGELPEETKKSIFQVLGGLFIGEKKKYLLINKEDLETDVKEFVQKARLLGMHNKIFKD